MRRKGLHPVLPADPRALRPDEDEALGHRRRRTLAVQQRRRLMCSRTQGTINRDVKLLIPDWTRDQNSVLGLSLGFKT